MINKYLIFSLLNYESYYLRDKTFDLCIESCWGYFYSKGQILSEINLYNYLQYLKEFEYTASIILNLFINM